MESTPLQTLHYSLIYPFYLSLFVLICPVRGGAYKFMNPKTHSLYIYFFVEQGESHEC